MRILVVTFSILTLAIRGFAQCHVPSLQGATLYESKSEIITNISIDLQDFAPKRLICLAKALKERYRDRDSIIVGIFSSQGAARYLAQPALPPEPQADDYEMFHQLHGSYVYRRDIHENYVLLMPDPMIDNPGASINTKIDFSTAAVPTCKLQIDNRCVLSLEHIDPPKDETAGAVTLTAEIEPSGAVSEVRVVDLKNGESGTQRSFVDYAVKNLKSWRFESRQNTSTMKIAYTLERVTTPLEHGISVQFRLPDRVSIQMSAIPTSH